MQYVCPRLGHFGTVTLDLPYDDPAYPHCPQCQQPMSKVRESMGTSEPSLSS
jgi:hypothetical protein